MIKDTPRTRATQHKRIEILKAAVEIFGSKGSTNGTLADVAEQVGLTHAGVLHHFGSKQKLLLEVLAYRDQADVEDLAEKHIPGGLELFLHLIRTAYANARRPGIVQAYTVLSSESVTDGHPGREYFEERYTTLRREATEAFEELCAREGVTDMDDVATRLGRSRNPTLMKARRLLPPAERSAPPDRVMRMLREHLEEPDYDWERVTLEELPPRPVINPPALTGIPGLGREDLVRICYALALANTMQLDIPTAIHQKMVKNALKYPPPADA